jgi:hypothetical protein
MTPRFLLVAKRLAARLRCLLPQGSTVYVPLYALGDS